MTEQRDLALRPEVDECYHLTLFVSGASELSARAIADARRLCDEHLSGRHRLIVVDIHDAPDAAFSRVDVAPTLIRHLPLPERKLVGNLSDANRVLSALLPAGGEDAGEARA